MPIILETAEIEQRRPPVKSLIFITFVALIALTGTAVLSSRAYAQGAYRYDSSGNYRWTDAYQAPRIYSRPSRLQESGQASRRSGASAKGRDCTPYNGPYGYYSNPWCDGGF